MIELIVCTGKNYEIGYENDMPWKRELPADLSYFRDKTRGKTVVMGRKTFESIVSSLGKPLPDRRNIVLTTDTSFTYEGVEVIHHLDEMKEKEVIIIGGASLYEIFLPKADRLYRTRIEETFVADTYFPNINLDEWVCVKTETHKKDEKNAYDYAFEVYERK